MRPDATLSLPELEAWMQAVLVHPGGAEEGLASAAAAAILEPERAPEVVKAAGGLSAAERLAIYAGMYPMRMREALASDYPVLLAEIGEHSFSHLVEDYVEAHPSRSYTLNRLGDQLPDFLASWGPRSKRAHLAGIARLELGITEAFDAPEAEPLGTEALERVPAGAWERVRFVPVPSFRVLAVPASSVAALDEAMDGSAPRRTSRAETWVALFRRDFTVQRRELSTEAGALLSRLSAGETLGDALAALEKRFRGRVSPDALQRWFRDWVAGGFFASLCYEDDVPAPREG